jgi:hypothetical protein
MVDRDDKVLAVYAIEREANHAGYAQGLVIIGFGITYIAVVTAYLADHIDGGIYTGVPAFVQALAPCITLSLLSAFVVNQARISLRTFRIRTMEVALEVELDSTSPHVKEPSFHRRAHFIVAARSAPPVLRIFAVLYYSIHVSILIVSLAFSAFCLAPGSWTMWKIVTAALYGTWFMIVAASLLLCFRHPYFNED